MCLWVIQIQCICGIIVNRIALLMVDRRMAAKIKWSVAIILGLINISVFCIWIPARLQISTTFVHVNEIWDRIEKVLFLFVDAALNFYFIYLVRTKLIACGLTKYMPLFKFNMFMVGVSMSLDVSAALYQLVVRTTMAKANAPRLSSLVACRFPTVLCTSHKNHVAHLCMC